MLSERLLLHPLIRDTLSDTLASWSWKASLRRCQSNYNLGDEEIPALQGNRRKANQVQGTDSMGTVSKMDKLTERPRHPSVQGAKRRQRCKIRGPEDVSRRR